MGRKGLAGHRVGMDQADGLGERTVPQGGYSGRSPGDCGAAGSRTGRGRRRETGPPEPAAEGAAEKDPALHPHRPVRSGGHRLSGALRHGVQGRDVPQHQGQRSGSERHDPAGGGGRADEGFSGAVRQRRFDRGGGREDLHRGYEQGAGPEGGRGGGEGICPRPHRVLPPGPGLAVFQHHGLS